LIIASVMAANIEERDALIVSVFSSRILADAQHLVLRIEICPFDPVGPFLTHRRGNGDFYNSTQRNLLSRIGLECCNEAVKPILGRAAVAFLALPNEPEPRESDAGKDDWLHKQNHSVNSRRVGQDRFDVSEVNRQSDATGALSGAFFAKLNQPVTAESPFENAYW
jgi:hypothetical protein